MSLWLASLLVVVTAALAIAAILAVRRGAPDGSYFNDGDRAAGVFGVLATGFSVLLGFIVFLAFTSYDDSRRGAEDEALIVGQQFETAQFLPEAGGRRAAAELVCYGRSIVNMEWSLMEDGGGVDNINPWGLALFRTLESIEPRTPVEETAYAKWLDQTFDRESARSTRLHGAEGVIPSPLWAVLFLIAAVIFGFMLFFADSGESRLVQATLMASVTLVIGATLVLISVLNAPFRPGPGSLRPIAMERTLQTLEEARAALGESDPLPCTTTGAATG